LQKYCETQLKQYKNYENLSHSRNDLDKECLEVQKGKAFYDFQFNTSNTLVLVIRKVPNGAEDRQPFQCRDTKALVHEQGKIVVVVGIVTNDIRAFEVPALK
ncbi:hypothetical protein S83_019628, partial [Arachis hypogaea]